MFVSVITSKYYVNIMMVTDCIHIVLLGVAVPGSNVGVMVVVLKAFLA